MKVLGIILARAGSQGLPGKCLRELCGQAVIAYTFDHALSSGRLRACVLTTDSEGAKALAHDWGVEVIDRPVDLATDTAPVDAAARHAVSVWEQRHGERVDAVVLLYGNIPLRAQGLIDRAIAHLASSGADSVRSVASVTKQHPDWIHHLAGDRMIQFRRNSIYRRQDLEPLYYHDGAVAVVTRESLFAAPATPDDHQAFWGKDRRAIVQGPEDAVDIDGPVDLAVAEGMLRSRAAVSRSGLGEGPTRAVRVRKRAVGGEPALPHLSACVPARAGGGDPVRRELSSARAAEPAVTIAGRTIGAGHRPFVIAEAGVNHNGDVETALRMVDVAVEAGADAVKFQMFRAQELTTPEAGVASYQRTNTGATTQRGLLASLELDDAAFAAIRGRCERRGIVFLATPFGVGDVKRLVSLEVAAIKLASTDLTNVPLLEASVAAGVGLILSTGASTREEMLASRAYLERSGASDRVVFLHCVSSYPTPVSSLNLRAMAVLRELLGAPIGLSDHTTWVHTGGIAVGAGACVLEKHFTLDRGVAGPDHAMSLLPSELAEYVEQVRVAERAMGDGVVGWQRIEGEVRRIARKSVVAATDIPAGTTIDASMLTVKRPGVGIAPGRLREIVGRRALVDIARDGLVSWDMVR